jgi:K+-sensing histidine kinase KdpD
MRPSSIMMTTDERVAVGTERNDEEETKTHIHSTHIAHTQYIDNVHTLVKENQQKVTEKDKRQYSKLQVTEWNDDGMTISILFVCVCICVCLSRRAKFAPQNASTFLRAGVGGHSCLRQAKLLYN